MVREEVERRENSFVFVVTTVTEFFECNHQDREDCPDRFTRQGRFFCSDFRCCERNEEEA